ncbi:MAG: PEP-CTERM sorting domain-containing protein [Fimbriimonadaceae bacterium]
MKKLAIIAFAASLVSAAQAVVFSVVSVGTYTLENDGYTTSEEVIFQITPSALDTMFFDATYVGQGADGEITYTGAGGTITLDFTAPGPFQFGGATSSLNGTWTYSSGTGDYAGYTSGIGTFAAVYNSSGQYASTTLTGDLEPVPEPASLVALGLGIAAFGRKLRRK